MLRPISMRTFCLLAVATVMSGISAIAAGQDLPPRIRVGVIMSMTGGAAPSAAAAPIPALKMAFKEIDEKGGIAGRPVDWVWADDGSDPTQAVNETRRLLDRERVNVVIGPNISTLAFAALPVLTQAKIASIHVAGSSSFTPQVAPYGFSSTYNPGKYAQTMVDYAVDVLKAKSIAILSANGAADKAVVEDFKKAIASRGIALTGEQAHEFRASDVTPQLLALRRGNPDVVLSQESVGEDGALVIKTMNEIGWKVRVLSNVSALLSASYLKVGGPDIYKDDRTYGLIFRNYTACKGAPVGQSEFARFLQSVKRFDPEVYGKLSIYTISIQYDGVMLLKAAIEGTRSVNGQVLANWIEQNASKLPAVTGKMQASTDNHILFSGDALTFVARPDIKRADDLLSRPDC